MGLDSHESEYKAGDKDATWTTGGGAQAEGQGDWSDEMESARQSATELVSSPTSTASPELTDSDVPDLEPDVTFYRPPGVYQPRLPHSLMDFGTDSDAPEKQTKDD